MLLSGWSPFTDSLGTFKSALKCLLSLQFLGSNYKSKSQYIFSWPEMCFSIWLTRPFYLSRCKKCSPFTWVWEWLLPIYWAKYICELNLQSCCCSILLYSFAIWRYWLMQMSEYCNTAYAGVLSQVLYAQWEIWHFHATFFKQNVRIYNIFLFCRDHHILINILAEM